MNRPKKIDVADPPKKPKHGQGGSATDDTGPGGKGKGPLLKKAPPPKEKE